MAAPEARPLENPCDRSLAAVVGVGSPAGEVGAEVMPDMPEAAIIGGSIPEPDWAC